MRIKLKRVLVPSAPMPDNSDITTHIPLPAGPRLPKSRAPVAPDLRERVDAVLQGHESHVYPRHDDLVRTVRQLAGEGRTDPDIAAAVGIRSVGHVKRLRASLGCAPDPEESRLWDSLGATDCNTPPDEAA